MNLLELIFTPEAVANIEKTGNVWGKSIEYDFNFKLRLWRRVLHVERRSAKNIWGRHGGGWDVKVGFMAGSWKSFFLMRDVVFSLGGTSVRVYRNRKE